MSQPLPIQLEIPIREKRYSIFTQKFGFSLVKKIETDLYKISCNRNLAP